MQSSETPYGVAAIIIPVLQAKELKQKSELTCSWSESYYVGCIYHQRSLKCTELNFSVSEFFYGGECGLVERTWGLVLPFILYSHWQPRMLIKLPYGWLNLVLKLVLKMNGFRIYFIFYEKERNYMQYIKVIHPLQWDPGADRLCQASSFESLIPIVIC